MVSSTHEQNSICSPKKLNDIAHEHTIICRQLFAGHVVGSRPMKRKKHFHRMIILFSRIIINVIILKQLVASGDVNIGDYHSMKMFLPFHWPRAHHVTCK